MDVHDGGPGLGGIDRRLRDLLRRHRHGRISAGRVRRSRDGARDHDFALHDCPRVKSVLDIILARPARSVAARSPACIYGMSALGSSARHRSKRRIDDRKPQVSHASVERKRRTREPQPAGPRRGRPHDTAARRHHGSGFHHAASGAARHADAGGGRRRGDQGRAPGRRGDALSPAHWDGEAAVFALLNRGKTTLALDLKREADCARLAPILARADILVEQFRPGVMQRFGLSYAAVRAVNPKVIYCSISGYGQEGPRAGESGHDINYIGSTGLLALQPGPRPHRSCRRR